MAVEAVFGGHTVWHSEIDKAASKVLAYRWPDVPNLGPITEIDWAAVEPVDVLCGGFPCTDVSAAGKRAGMHGTRAGLWSYMAVAIDVLRPRYVVIENVRGLLNASANRPMESDSDDLGNGSDRPVLRAIGAVLGDLADIGGYEARWVTVAAADVGAPHRRERVFIVARAVSHAGHDAGCAECGFEHAEQACGVGQSGGGVAADATVDGLGGTEERGEPGASSGTRVWDRPSGSGDEPGRVELLPTPCVVDRLASGERTLDEWDESRKSQKERGVGSFGPRGDSLGAAILRVEEGSERPDYSTTKARRGDEPGRIGWIGHRDRYGVPYASNADTEPEPGVALLPTPNASDGSGGGQHPDKREGHSRQLIDYVLGLPLLQTPQARDGKGLPGHGFNEGNLLSQVIEAENTCSHPADARLISDSAISCGVCSCRLSVDDAARSYGTHWGKYAPAIARWESLTRPAPAPTEPNKNGNPRLSAEFSQWLMGWPDGWVTDPAIGISRNDQLRILGNGVVVQQAIAALRYLLAVTA